ncbi:MAG: adenylate/guanylate cyclase domain-containing protein [Desulfobulbales bacterium]|nr:adenylate/guanylate cyclase domain-containing protein [Desulfobulbales bacterium]
MTGKSLLRYQVIFTAICLVLVTGAVILCYRAGFFSRADNYLYDLNLAWRGPLQTSERITLVLMDEESAVRLNRHRGQWSRANLAAALDHICAAGASVVGLDMIMSAPDPDPAVDLRLARSIRECNNVVMARVSAAQGVAEITPLELFQEEMIGDGFIDVPLDQDGILRKIRFFNAKPFAAGGLQLLPAFALEVSRVFLNLEFDFDFSGRDYFLMGGVDERRLRLPYPELLINYHGDYTAFNVVSYADAVKNSVPPEKLRGKIVLIGSTLSTQKDFFTTPFSRFQRDNNELAGRFGTIAEDVMGADEPGVACHAHAIETILGQIFIRHATGYSVMWLLVFSGMFGLLFYLPRISMSLEVFILAAGMTAVLFVAHWLFLHKSIRVDIAPLLAIFAGQFMAGVALQKSFDRQKTALITSIFGKYVSAGVVNELIKGDIATTLEGRRENLTILFSDLRGFTTISEKLGARQTGRLLNRYFDAMIPLVFAHQGTLDKLMGDAVMAFFGAPLPLPDHPAQAAATALLMMEKLGELKEGGEVDGAAELEIGIGLNTGEVTVGNLGSNVFMDYTIIGDAVNLASRLEGLNKVYGTHILCSEFTARELDDRFLLRDLDIVKVKGKAKAVTIYELAGWRDRQDVAAMARFSLFGEGLAAYRRQEWDRAEQSFGRVLEELPKDGPTRLYLDRIARFRENPPPADWRGVTIFDHK